MIWDSENLKSSDSESEYIEYDVPNDTTFDIPVDYVLSKLVARDEESGTWRFRKGSGSALVFLFTTENGGPIPFVSTVERGSKPCPIGSSSTRSYIYKVVKCAHRNKQAKGVRPCKARATLKFFILSEEDFQRAGISYRLVHVIWDRDEAGVPIPCLHLRGAISRGIVRKAERLKLMETTAMPSHMTIKSVESHDRAVEKLLTGNRTGLLISQSAAHKARSRGRKELFHEQGDTFLDLQRAQRDSWEAHDQHGFQNLPIHRKLKSFLG
ncbi:hypothetical protein FGB62_101g015 [Gracilaria domingensis]|nr:hypothetical protein FGB62_101g015 [Gracilaria domingensis]